MPEGATGGATELALTMCDKEPIHIPGSIQPHGAMLVVDAPTLRVIGQAGIPVWDKSVVGTDLLDLFPPRDDVRFNEMHKGLNVLGDVAIGTARYDVVAFETGNRIVVELTPRIAGPKLNAKFMASLEASGRTSSGRSPKPTSFKRQLASFSRSQATTG